MTRISCILVLQFLVFLLITGCGIPENRSLEKPIVLDSSKLGLYSSVLAFKTPSDTTNILGYALFYKVYYSQSDFDNEQDKDKWFDEYSYINDNDEMQPGSVIGNQRGFIPVGELGAETQSYPSYLIEDPPMPSTTIYIDFDSIQHRLVISNDSPQPIVGFEYPISTVKYTLARGIIDPTAGSDDSFRLFVADWDYDDGQPDDNFYDADLRRRYDIPASNIPATVTEYYMGGDPFFEIADQEPTQFLIGFVAYSYGIDPSNFQILTSKPVFVGVVGYSPISDTKKRIVTRP